MYVPHNVYMMVSHSCWILLCIFCKCDQACVHVCVCVCVCVKSQGNGVQYFIVLTPYSSIFCVPEFPPSP